jgi:hypothetical protein
MGVPNTNTFSLQDVVDEINPTTDDLQDCINDANSADYDPNYYTAPATSLLEFRNYGNTINVTSFQLSSASSAQSSGACSLSLATKQTLYFNGTTTYPTLNQIVYTNSSLTSAFNGGFNWWRSGNGASRFQISFYGEVTVVSSC